MGMFCVSSGFFDIGVAIGDGFCFVYSFSVLLAEFLARKYNKRNIRVIVASGPQALQFAAEFHNQMFMGVPVVHIAVPRDQLEQMALPADIVGKTVDLDPTATLELALRLQPDATHLVFVLGAGERDRIWEQRLRSAVGQLPEHTEIEYLKGLPTSVLLQRLRALNKRTIVFTPGYFVDGEGHVATPRRSMELIGEASAAPVYAPIDTSLGTGIVGGSMATYESQAKEAGAIVVRLLTGTTPAQIARSSVTTLPVVDWRQVRRWGLDEHLLPANTVVMFREPNVWDKYWREISTGIAILLLQAGLIAALLIQRRRWRVAEQAVQVQRSEIAHASRLAIAGELTASIAHEINQPLGAILSNVDAADLVIRSGADRRELLLQILADIRRDDLRASEVMRRLRALLARHETEQAPIDLKATVTEVAALLQVEAERRRVTLEIRPSAVAWVVGDRIQVQQVLINLLLNAFDAVSDAGEDRRGIVVTLNNVEHGIVITVRDRGHGIGPEDLARIFDSFYSTKRSGMGIGLSIRAQSSRRTGGVSGQRVSSVRARHFT